MRRCCWSDSDARTAGGGALTVGCGGGKTALSRCERGGGGGRTVQHMGWVRRSLTMDECPSLAIPNFGRCPTGPRRGKGRLEMRKLHVLGVALIAVVAFGVVSAATASAVTFLLAEWLVGGSAVTSTALAETTGELLIAEELTVLGVKIKIAVLCSGIFVGSIGSDGADDLTELLNLARELIDLTPLVELGLLCTNDENCPEPLAWADNLPWLTQLELMVDGSEEFFVDLLTANGNGSPGYHVVCMGNTALADLCTAPESTTKVTNEAGGLNSEFSEAFTTLAGLKLANCEIAGNETGIVEGLALVTTPGGALTASE